MNVRQSLMQARFELGEDMDRLSLEVHPGVRLSASGFASVADELLRTSTKPWRVAYSFLHLACDESGYSLAERIEAIERARAKRSEADIDSHIAINASRKAA